MGAATRLAGATLIFLCGLQTAAGDTVVLKNGGRIEGEIDKATGEAGGEAAGEGEADAYRVKTSLGLVALPRRQVDRVVEESPAEKQYRELVAAMSDDAEGHWKMAEWCRTNDLADLRSGHLEKVIAFDPEHEAARRALGYSQVDGAWRKVDEVMLSKGYVRHRGAWRLPQEIVLETRAAEIDRQQKEWRKRLKMWRGWIGAKRGNEALANFRSVDDPLASLALAEMLLSEKNRDVKLLYIDVLSRLPSPTAVGALIQASLDDDDDTVRDACLTKLAERGTQQAVSAYSLVLKGVGSRTVDIAENTQINRAGEGLARMKDPHSVKTLIDALVTKYKVLVQPGSGNVGVAFGNGGGGLSAGNKPHYETQEVGNKTVLDALVVITEQNFGYDRDRWRAWYAENRTPDGVDLRRGGF